METPYVDYSEFYKKLDNGELNLGDSYNPSPVTLPNISRPINIPSAIPSPSTEKSESQTMELTESKNKTKKEDLNKESPLPKKLSEKEEITDYINKLELDSKYKNYLIKLAQRESGFNPNIVNKQGYKGLFQMGDDALKDIGMTTEEYMSDWKKQIDAILKYTNKNKTKLSTIISSNSNRDWNGTPITEYGILGAAHLGGATGLTNLLLQGIDKKDSNQTTISDYLTYFSS